MARTFALLSLLLWLGSTTHALTDAEIAQFQARDVTEQNTGLQGEVSLTKDGDTIVITSNGIPDHDTGDFPHAQTNPNSIEEQNNRYTIDLNPSIQDEDTCLPGGPIAFTINGVPMFNPFNINGENAVEGDTAEVFDDCQGHPDAMGVYHYHQNPSCVYDGSPDTLVGVALDGFPIYGYARSDGADLTSADLDECHGMETDDGYRYVITRDYPYIMGCLRGNPAAEIANRVTGRNCLFAKTTDDGSDNGANTGHAGFWSLLICGLTVLRLMWL